MDCYDRGMDKPWWWALCYSPGLFSWFCISATDFNGFRRIFCSHSQSGRSYHLYRTGFWATCLLFYRLVPYVSLYNDVSVGSGCHRPISRDFNTSIKGSPSLYDSGVHNLFADTDFVYPGSLLHTGNK